MRGLIWLLGFLLVANKKDDPPTKPPRDGIIFIKGMILKKLAQLAASLIKLFFRMRVVDVPTEIKVEKLAPQKMYDHAGFVFHEKEFNKDTVYKNFNSPIAANYKLVAFPGLVGLIEVLLVALVRRWGIANYEELRSVEEQCQLKDIGLGDTFNIISLGTIVKRSSVSVSFCAPLVTFYTNQISKEREKRLSLHDLLFDPVSSGTYILFRAKLKPKK